MSTHRTKIVVFGGSGFLGREICRIARSMGHRIISVSKSGRPSVEERWAHGIDWVTADVFEPASWSSHLEDAEAVIDCIGEAECADDGKRSVERPAQLIADHAEEAGVDSVVYISAASAPASAASYLEARREAESSFEGRSFSATILRPALIQSADRPGSLVAGALVDLIGRVSGGDEWAQSRRGLRREKVAICALRAALEADISGVLDIDDIAHLGDAMFIQ